MLKVSLVILTWNRKESVETSLKSNLLSTGYPLYELIHVDNGSEPGFTEWFKEEFKPDTQVCNKKNMGVAAGYNRGFVLSTGTHVALTGCDRIMPKDWLWWFALAHERIENLGVVSCYTAPHTERYRGGDIIQNRNALNFRRSIPVEARMHSKEFLFKTGFWREDFGLYGYEDSEWSNRAERVALENGLINVTLPDMGYATHLSDKDFPHQIDGLPYNEYKNKIHADPRRKNMFEALHRMGSPYYNPFTRTEPDLLDTLGKTGPKR